MERKNFMENLQQRTIQGKAKKAAEDEALRLKNKRIDERTAKIKALLQNNSEEVADFLLEEVLESIGRMADKGERFTHWCPAREVNETLQDQVVAKLRELGLEVRVGCGKCGGTECRGRSGYTCWPSVMIWWRAS